MGIKLIVHPSPEDINDPKLSPEERKRLDGLHGTLVLADQHGFPAAFINAAEVTGYRTTLSAMIGFVRRSCVGRVVLFGAGKQGLWHLRIMLGLRGADIERVTVVNRNLERAEEVVGVIRKENDGENGGGFNVDFECVAADDDSGKLEERLREADVVFCTTGSRKPLFPADWVKGAGKGGKGRYISAIGSWQADMIELESELVKGVAGAGGTDAGASSAAASSGDGDAGNMIIVDNATDCLENTGEFLHSGLDTSHVTEVGIVLQQLEEGKSDDKLEKCVKEGYVIYKSVGVGLTDLAAGQALVELAREKGKGIAVEDF